MLNPIAIKILVKLMKTEKGIKYSEIEEGMGVEDDLFNYHLQNLCKKGLVEKSDNLYRLSVEGRIEIQKYDSEGRERCDYFRISVLLFVVDSKSQILLQKRLRHPLLGDINTPSGKVMSGENFSQAASRKLFEETGLKAKFKFVGAFRSCRYDNYDYLLEDTIYHVCVAEKFSGKLREKSEYGDFFWASFEDYLKWQKKNKAGSITQQKVIERVWRKNYLPFYWEEKLRNVIY